VIIRFEVGGVCDIRKRITGLSPPVKRAGKRRLISINAADAAPVPG
jgi:hypothetical protein